MVSVSVPGMSGWGNPSSQLPGGLGLSPSHRSGLGAPFFMAKLRRDAPPSSTKTTHPRRLGVPMTRAALGMADRLGSVLSGRRVLSRVKGGDVL
jgi:hypothetical protein